MRLEIDIADERPEAEILSSLSDPSAYVLDLVRRAGSIPAPEPTPDYLAILEQVRQSPNRFKTKEEVDAYLRDLW